MLIYIVFGHGLSFLFFNFKNGSFKAIYIVTSRVIAKKLEEDIICLKKYCSHMEIIVGTCGRKPLSL